MRINQEKLIRLIQDSEFGTGTLSQALRKHPDDLQRLIGRGEGDEKFIARVEGILGDTITPLPPPEPQPQPEVVVEEEPQSETELEAEPPDEALAEEGIDAVDEPLRMVKRCTVNEIISLVESGEFAPELVLDAENMREEPRVTLINWLKDRVKDND